jgi:hypothetical protein
MTPPTVPHTLRELVTQMTNCYWATLILSTVISSDGR